MWALLVAQTVKSLPAMQETGFTPWVGKIPWRREWQPTPVFLPGESHGQRNVLGYRPWGCKESNPTEQLTYTHIYFTYGSVYAFMLLSPFVSPSLSSPSPMSISLISMSASPLLAFFTTGPSSLFGSSSEIPGTLREITDSQLNRLWFSCGLERGEGAHDSWWGGGRVQQRPAHQPPGPPLCLPLSMPSLPSRGCFHFWCSSLKYNLSKKMQQFGSVCGDHTLWAVETEPEV